MSVKVTKRQTNDGPRYSISSLTFGQLFRIKTAMFEEENRMKEIEAQCVNERDLAMARAFGDHAKDAHEVAIAVADGCF